MNQKYIRQSLFPPLSPLFGAQGIREALRFASIS
jgi:hypothetical protein